MAADVPTFKSVQDRMTADDRESYLWESLAVTVESFHGDRGASVLHHARLRGMKPADLTSIELAGPVSDDCYPALHFAGEGPQETFCFSPKGGFRHTQFD